MPYAPDISRRIGPSTCSPIAQRGDGERCAASPPGAARGCRRARRVSCVKPSELHHGDRGSGRWRDVSRRLLAAREEIHLYSEGTSVRGGTMKHVPDLKGFAKFGPYSPAVVANGFIFIAGQAPVKPGAAPGELAGSKIGRASCRERG